MPTVALWPKPEGSEIGRPAYRSPSIGVFGSNFWLALEQKAKVMSERPSLGFVEHRFGFFDSAFAPFGAEIDQQLSVGRQVAPSWVHLPVEPLTVLERVGVGVPLHDMNPFARPTA